VKKNPITIEIARSAKSVDEGGKGAGNDDRRIATEGKGRRPHLPVCKERTEVIGKDGSAGPAET